MSARAFRLLALSSVLTLAACGFRSTVPVDTVASESPTPRSDASGDREDKVDDWAPDASVSGMNHGEADLEQRASFAEPMPAAEVSVPAPTGGAGARVHTSRKRAVHVSGTHTTPAKPPSSPAQSRAPQLEAMPLEQADSIAATTGYDMDPGAGPFDAQAVATPLTDANGNTYTDHGVNPFTMTEKDALSTFSIDVDTASYALARRQLEAGGLPDMASVRVEEFVNYFDYDSYAQPTGDVPFAVHMEAMPDPFRPGRHLLRVGVQGKDVSRDERQPVHLTFLVDVSGSMGSADKLGLAKNAMHMMVDGLKEADTVAFATYAGRTARVLEPTSAANKRRIHSAIDSLSSGGSTAMSAGIDIAYDMASESFVEGHENRVVVMSDGDANVGRTSWDDMLSQIKVHADAGVTLSTIGFGMGNYRDTLMEQLSNKGDGNNFYIDSQAQAQRVFVEELSGTMVTIARDTKIQVEFNPDAVSAYRLVGYENRDIADKDFRNDRVDAGEIGAGHNVTALYEVILKDDYERDLATVRMRWEAPGADTSASERAYGFDSSALAEASRLASKDTRIAYASATFAEVLRGSPHASEIDMAQLIAFTKDAARTGKKDDQQLIQLMKQAQQLGAGQRSMAVSSR